MIEDAYAIAGRLVTEWRKKCAASDGPHGTWLEIDIAEAIIADRIAMVDQAGQICSCPSGQRAIRRLVQ